MTRSPRDRIIDIPAAIDKCKSFRSRLRDADPVVAEMAFDATLRNMGVIGEAVNHLPEQVTAVHSEIDWPAIVGMRNILIHQYYEVDAALVERVLDRNLAPLAAALRAHIGD